MESKKSIPADIAILEKNIDALHSLIERGWRFPKKLKNGINIPDQELITNIIDMNWVEGFSLLLDYFKEDLSTHETIKTIITTPRPKLFKELVVRNLIDPNWRDPDSNLSYANYAMQSMYLVAGPQINDEELAELFQVLNQANINLNDFYPIKEISDFNFDLYDLSYQAHSIFTYIVFFTKRYFLYNNDLIFPKKIQDIGLRQKLIEKDFEEESNERVSNFHKINIEKKLLTLDDAQNFRYSSWWVTPSGWDEFNNLSFHQKNKLIESFNFKDESDNTRYHKLALFAKNSKFIDFLKSLISIQPDVLKYLEVENSSSTRSIDIIWFVLEQSDNGEFNAPDDETVWRSLASDKINLLLK